MKDSKGREYDGWVLKTEKGLLPYTFAHTRWHLYDRHGYPSEPGADGYGAVKVRLVEVVE